MAQGTKRSEDLFRLASVFIPGGVNSPVRAFKSVGGVPRFITRAQGAQFWDVDGNCYIDYIGSWGPMILGHRDPVAIRALTEALERGTSFGAPTELEVEMAQLVTELVPSVEMVRMVNSGTEATMSALRLARAYTRRERIIKFNGCYHGHSDSLLVAAGSGVATLGIPGSPGVPQVIAERTVSIPFNDLQLLEQTISSVGPTEIAAVIIEPVAGNMGLVLPKPGFLQGVRELCTKHGIVLIFDEVMTGFRVALGGAQERFGVLPDLTTLGKVIGGGLPVGAFGGRREIMSLLAPLGSVYQAGTLSGNPLAMAAGFSTLRILRDENPYPRLEETAQRWRDGMLSAAREAGVPLVAYACGAMVGLFFSSSEVLSYEDAKKADTESFNKFFHAMLERGVYLAPSAFEAGFISTAHTPEIIERTITAAREAFKGLR